MPTASAKHAVPTSGAVSLAPLKNTARCLQAASALDGAAAVMADCDESAEQKWEFTNRQVVQQSSGKCLTMPNANAYNWAQPTVTACSGEVSQKWALRGDHIKYGDGNHCLDTPVGNTNVGTAMIVWECASNNTNQMWVFTKNGATTIPPGTTPTPPLAGIPSDPNRYLKAVGRDLRTAAGNRVMLRGTNLGAWLKPAAWLNGITDSTPNADGYFYETLQARGFTPDQINALTTTFADNWITTTDLDNIKSYNFNMIRVFFTPSTLQNADGSWKLDANGNIDFTRLDWMVKQAAARGLYVIFTLSDWERTRDKYWLISGTSAESIAIQEKTALVWKAVAKRYKGNSIIAGFDVLNEPTGSPGNLVHNTLYAAVRSEDPNRLVIMESTGFDPRWSNVMYSLHTYNLMSNLAANQATFARDLPNLRYWADRDVPLYIGELMTSGDSWSWLLQKYNEMGIHWSPFAYKTVDMGGWGLINVYRRQINANTDSYETILSKLRQMKTVAGNYYAMNESINSQSAAAAAP